MFWLDDLVVILFVVCASSIYLISQLFLKNQSTFNFWEKLDIQNRLQQDSNRSVHSLDHQLLMQQTERRFQESNSQALKIHATDHTTFVLSEFSLPVCRSLWRIVEYVLTDFIDFWWVKISDSPDFSNDLRDVFDHAFNVLGERSIRIDWSPFIVKNVISNLNYLMRIYRLTEQELSTHNTFFSDTPELARHRLIKAELMRTYKLHVAVSNPKAYLRKLSTAILSQLLRSTDFRSETVRTMTRELVTNFIFMPVMNFVDPYWLNIGLIKFLKLQLAEKDAAAAADNHRHKPHQHHPTTNFNNVGYSSLHSPSSSKHNSRSNSPTRGNFTMPVGHTSMMSSPDEDNFGPLVESPAFDPLTPVVTDAADPYNDGNFVPHRRKESLLTMKMKEWDNEKAKRNEKKNSRKHHPQHAHTLGGHGHRAQLSQGANQSGSSNHHPDSHHHPSAHHNASASVDLTRPHDDDVPTGLLSPSGAFSHSPNHATSPVNGQPLVPHPSQLTTNWEVRIIGAGIRFDPKPFVTYELLVRNGDLKWTVVKRYNKFEELHQKLKKAIPSFDAQLPKKSYFGNLDQQFIQNRKVELQTYLGQLLWNKNVQENADLQQFLLPSADDQKWSTVPGGGTGDKTPNTIASSSSFSFFGPPKKMADDTRTPPTGGQPTQQPFNQTYSQSVMPPTNTNLLMQQSSLPLNPSSTLQQAAANGDDMDTFPSTDTPPSQHPSSNSTLDSPQQRRQKSAHHLLRPNDPTIGHHVSPPNSPLPKPPLQRAFSTDDLGHQPGARSQAGFNNTSSNPTGSTATGLFSLNWDADKALTDPLYLLVEEIFNLNGRGWVRRQATWVGKQLVRMTMDGLIKERLNKQVDSLLNETTLTAQIDWVTELIWPNGKLFESQPPPTQEEKDQVKEEALKLLIQSIPSSLKTLLGKEHCIAAMEKCFQFMQMEPLIQHFAYSVLDSLVLELFPDLTHVLGR